MGDKLVQALTQASLVSTQVDTLVTYCEQANIHIICTDDDCWPQGLRECSDAPLVLYVRG